MKKLKTKISSYFGQTLNLPLVGETQIEADGTIEVDETVSEMLLRGEDWEEVQEEVEEEENDEEEDELNNEEDSEEEEEEEEGDAEEAKQLAPTPTTNKKTTKKTEDKKVAEENEKIKAQLETMSLAQMIELAEESKLNYTLFKKDETKMRSFLLKKMTASA